MLIFFDRHFWPFFVCATLFWAMVFCAMPRLGSTQETELKNLTNFMRVTQPDGQRQPVAMETAIVRLTDDKQELTVDLIAAVHIGDKEYYEELNDVFKYYDAVLYELVTDDSTKLSKEAEQSKEKKGNKKDNMLSTIQAGMGEALDLDFQLLHVDYKAKNLVHADLSAAEFASRASERGDMLQILYRAFILGGQKDPNNEMKKQGRLLGMLFASDPSLSLKRLFAKEMIEQMNDSMFLFGGGEGGSGSAIITDRNAAALAVLRSEIDSGKKKLAIFYGAAHLPEFVKSLEKDFSLQRRDVSWIVAWDLTKDRSARPAAPPISRDPFFRK